MRVLLASEFRCTIYKGDFYLPTRAYVIYERYANTFGDIVLCSRFEEVDNLPFDCIKVEFIKDIINCKNLTNVLLGLKGKDIMEVMKNCDLVIGRFPSIIAFKARDYARKLGKLFLAELMCDGWDSYWNHSVIGKIIAPYMNWKMKISTIDADFAIYVTEFYLQNKYPCKNPSINASNVVINDINVSTLKKRLNKIKNMNYEHISLMTSANVDQASKGQEYVVKAIKLLKDKKITVKYYLVGDGNQSYLTNLAIKEGVLENIVFTGRLSNEDVLKKLDEIDIYIQPSLQEGLPRAVIEAMSRACPALGANTAGIPELLDEECVFNRASSYSIMNSIENISNIGLSKYAINNFEHSKKYYNPILNERRNEYFKKIKEKVEECKKAE